MVVTNIKEANKHQKRMRENESEREKLERELREWKSSPECREARRLENAAKMVEERIPEYARAVALDFYRDMKRRGLRAASIRSNITGLRRFLEWYNSSCDWNGWEEVTTEVLCEYVGHEMNTGLKASTVRTRTVNLRAFFTYLEDEGRIERSPWTRRAMVKMDKPLPRAMTLDDLDDWVDALETAPVFDRAMLLLLLKSGIRIGELMNMRVQDVDMEQMSIRIYVGEKNRLGRIVHFTKDARRAIEEWLAERMRTGVDSEYLFAKKKGVLSYSGYRNISEKNFERAGLKGKYSLHSIRHTYATLLVNAGMELQYLQRLMGHDSIQTTLRYVVVDEREAHEEYHRVIEEIERRARKHD